MRRLSPLTYTLSTCLLCYGFVLFLFGPCLTAIAQTFDAPLGDTGLLFTFFSAGLIPSVLAIGFLSEVLGKRRILIASTLTMAAGCALFAGAASTGPQPSYPLALATMVVIGVGGGGVETLTNAPIADDNRPSPGFALNFSHAFFAIGAVFGPLAAGALLRARLPWQAAFFGAAGLLVALTLAMVVQQAPRHRAETGSTGPMIGLLRSAVLWGLLVVLAVYVGAEVGLTAWVSPLMEEVLGADRGTAALAVSAFWACMIVGRLITTYLSTRVRAVPIILVLACGSAAASLGVARSSGIAVCLAMSAATGLFMSGLFGMVVTDGAERYPERTGALFGLLITGVGAGAMVVPAAMGWIASAAGLRTAMLIPPALMAAVAVAYLVPLSR